MQSFQRQIPEFVKFLLLAIFLKTSAFGSTFTDQAINSGGGWSNNADHSSFNIYGELFQSTNAKPGQFNLSPIDLNSTAPLSIAENQPIGTIVGEFNATDPDGDDLTFHFVSDLNDNHLFTLETDGKLRTATIFDFENNATTYSVQIQAKDEFNATIDRIFEVELLDDPNDVLQLEVSNFSSNGELGLIGELTVPNQTELRFRMRPDREGSMHHFALDENGSLSLVDNFDVNNTSELAIQVFRDEELILQDSVTVRVGSKEKKPILGVNTSDSAYHESALMIRELKVVRDDWRNGHNPISSIGAIAGKSGLFVTTAQPHGRKHGDSVVLSGVEGLEINGLKNWNFMIDEVSQNSFRIRHFGKDTNGEYDGSFGSIAEATGTSYKPSPRDYLLGPWTFGHLLGNMVGELDDPVIFYKHFVDQWNHNQMVNGWPSGTRRLNRFTARNDSNLTMANLPFRLLAIGNRLDLFHAKSMTQVDDAGEGRFVFTNVSSFDVPEREDEIWKVHEVNNTRDQGGFTLIFEYGQPAKDFATLANWAKDWHALEVDALDIFGNFNPTNNYLERLNDLTDRFSKRGSNPRKTNGNPINQVRTNEVFGGVWQMREFNLLNKSEAEQVRASPDRETRLLVDPELESIDAGLWTTTTKNNPMIGDNNLDPSLKNVLARWINQRESHILDGDVGPRAPDWMEGAVSNQPFGFSYSKQFGFSGARINLARYKYSLSTCSGCHNGDTGTPFQMIKSQGNSRSEAFFANFMVGDGMGEAHIQNDIENKNEKHAFFDLKEREEIVRDILHLTEQVESAKLRLTRTELDINSSQILTRAFIRGGVIGDWEFELPSNRLDNDLFTMGVNGDLFYKNNLSFPKPGAKQIFVRATSLDGSGYVLERPYSLWILNSGENRLSEDLDPSIQPSTPPPLETPRPNRTH